MVVLSKDQDVTLAPPTRARPYKVTKRRNDMNLSRPPPPLGGSYSYRSPASPASVSPTPTPVLNPKRLDAQFQQLVTPGGQNYSYNYASQALPPRSSLPHELVL